MPSAGASRGHERTASRGALAGTSSPKRGRSVRIEDPADDTEDGSRTDSHGNAAICCVSSGCESFPLFHTVRDQCEEDEACHCRPRSLAIWLLLLLALLYAVAVKAGAPLYPGGMSWHLVGSPGGRTGPCPIKTPAAHKLLTCNHSAFTTWVDPVHQWNLSSEERQLCKEKNKEQFWWQFPEERNWCWVGLKAQCHAEIEMQRSWPEIQDRAAEMGLAPPRQRSAFSPLKAPDLCDRPELGSRRPWTAGERASAWEWFESHVAVYVVSLPGEHERWQFISKRLEELGICYTRVSGVDFRVSGQLQAAKDAGWMPQAFNVTLVQERADSEKHEMGSVFGTLGVASAHFKVQAEVIHDARPLAVVFEDDVEPVEDFVERLWSLVMEELPCDWEVVSLMSRCPYGRCVSPHLTRVHPDINEPAWRCRQGVNWGTEGLLYRTAALKTLRELWQQVVFDEERPHCLNVDAALASISDQVVYYAVPAVQSPGFLREKDFPSVRYSINAKPGSSDMPEHGLGSVEGALDV
mmetsp:Transcript_7281/g.18158  ORF Transcript_7281/g.18158 Transcript_7281/m.18158 type:complete len:523 (+) Transcript_7281:172-1740(+)